MRQTVTENRLFSKKDLRKLIIPLILEQTLAITVGMADTMMFLLREKRQFPASRW